MRIFISTLTKRRYILEVESSDTIGSVKDKVEEVEGVAADLQRLIFAARQLMDDNRTLAEYNVQENSILYLIIKIPGGGQIVSNVRPGGSLPSSLSAISSTAAVASSIKIFVITTTGKRITLELERNDSIDYLKAKIQENEGVPLVQQNLFFAGIQLKDNSLTLADYYIHDGSSLQLYDVAAKPQTGGMQIFVKIFSGVVEREGTITLEVESSDTIDSVKAKIQDEVLIPLEYQLLTFDQMELENGWTLADYEIPNESTIHLLDRNEGVHSLTATTSSSIYAMGAATNIPFQAIIEGITHTFGPRLDNMFSQITALDAKIDRLERLVSSNATASSSTSPKSLPWVQDG